METYNIAMVRGASGTNDAAILSAMMSRYGNIAWKVERRTKRRPYSATCSPEAQVVGDYSVGDAIIDALPGCSRYDQSSNVISTLKVYPGDNAKD